MLPGLYHAQLSEKLTRSNYLLTILLIQVVQSILSGRQVAYKADRISLIALKPC